MKEELIRLINPRGRIISVKPLDAPQLLSKGFLHAPKQSGDYNPVFDNIREVDARVQNLSAYTGVRKVALSVDRVF
jgi:hypothetical protein